MLKTTIKRIKDYFDNSQCQWSHDTEVKFKEIMQDTNNYIDGKAIQEKAHYSYYKCKRCGHANNYQRYM